MVWWEEEKADSTKQWELKVTGDWDIVNVVEDKSALEKLWEWAWQVAGLVGMWWNWLTEHLSVDKQDIDRELYGLKKWNQAITTKEGKSEYIQKLYDYDNLLKKDQLSSEDLANLFNLNNELQEYTVADRPHTFWSWLKNFWLDYMRDDTFQSSEYARTKVDTKEILKNLWDVTKRAFGVTDKKEDENGIQTVTKEEYENIKKWGFNEKYDNIMKAAAKKLQDQGYQAERNPWGRQSTIDEIMQDLEVGMADRSNVIQIESMKALINKLWDKAPVITQEAESNCVEWLVDMVSYILQYDWDSEEARQSYLENHDDPYALDLNKLKDNKDLNEYEKALINSSILWRAWDLLRYNNTDGYYWVDASTTADQLVRLIDIWKNISNMDSDDIRWSIWEWGEALWNTFMYWSSVLWWYVGQVWSLLWAWIMSAANLNEWSFWDWQFLKDLQNYMIWLQNSTIFTTKENHQNKYTPQWFMDWVEWFILDYYSVVDDIATAWMEGKLLDFPLKAAKAGDLWKIVVKWAETSKAIEKTAEWTSKIISAWEKIQWVTKWTSYIKKVGEWIKTFFKDKYNSKVEWLKALRDLDTWAAVKLWAENFVRWVAEEALTSAAFQWLTPYDYTVTDLGMDITWAMISGWMRATQFNNKLGLTKLQSQDAGWVTWWFRDVYKDTNWKKLSDVDVQKKISWMTAQDMKEMADRIKRATGVLVDDSTTITNKQFLSNAQKLWKEWRKAINTLADTLIKNTDDNLKLEFSRSADKSVNSLVKKTRKKWADGKYTVTLEWNKWNKSEKKFAKQVTEARTKLFGGKTVDNLTSARNFVKRINMIKKDIKKRLPSIIARTAKRYLVEKVNWVWKFKKGVSADEIKKLEKQKINEAVNKLTKAREQVLKTWADESVFWITTGARNEIDPTFNPFGLHQLLNVYLNNMLLRKKFKKEDIVNWLRAMWWAVYTVFAYWLKDTYPEKWWVEDFSLRELVSAVKEFWRRYDKEIFPEWNLAHRSSNIDDGLKTPDQYMANMTFEQAKQQNPDLMYMWQNMFRSIVEDVENGTLTLEEAEMKLRNFRRWGRGSDILVMEWDVTWHMWRWTHIFWIDEKDSAGWGRKAFNDTYEEKKVFWTWGKIYLKISEDSGNMTASKHAAQKEIVPFRRNSEWVIECTYERKEISGTDGHITYFVYDKNGVQVATIVTLPDVDFSKLGKKPRAWDMFPKGRLMSIQFIWDYKEKWISADFEVIKWDNKESKIYNTDIDLTIKDDMVLTKNTYEENWRTYKRTSTLKQWNKFSEHVRGGKLRYKEFRWLIPGYTDRVPEFMYNRIMKDDTLDAVDKQRLLISIMTNKKTHMSKDGLVIKTWGRTFTAMPYQKKVPQYNEREKLEIVWYKTVNVPGEWQLFRNEYYQGSLLFTRDDWTVEAFQFVASDKPGIYHLYRSPDATTPSGVVFIWDDGVKAYLTEGKKRIYAKQIELMDHTTNLDWANKVIDERFANVTTKVEVPEGDEYYKEIHKRLYGTEMSEEEYHKLLSTPSMTPERYLNNEIQKFKQSRFGTYVKITGKTWETVSDQIRIWKEKVSMAEKFVNKYEWDELKLSDQEIMKVVDRIYEERLVNEGKLKLTPAEKEIRDILYGKNKVINDDESEIIWVYWYSMFWKEPSRLESRTLIRLRTRRDNILLAIFHDPDILDLTDWEKEALVTWAKRKGLMDWTEDQLIQDIVDHPELYSVILDALRKSMARLEWAVDDSKEVARLERINARLAELEDAGVNRKNKKKAWPNVSKIQQKIAEYQQWEVTNLLQQAQEEIIAADEAWNTAARNAAYTKKYELEEYQKRVQEEEAYKKAKRNWAYTEEQFAFLAKARMWGKDAGLINERPLSQKEVNDRILHIQARMPWMRFIEVDPATWKTRLRGFTEEEKLLYKEQIDTASQAVLSWKANAAHVRELHAIVINPRQALSNTLWHEWFHEAITLMADKKWTPGKIDNLMYDTYQKHQSDINSFASARGYDVEYWELLTTSPKDYQRQITEEWLAERFWEYVNSRYNEALNLDSEVIEFFRYLWEKMRMMFSDTNALELFEDIYEGRVDYWDITIDLNARNAGTIKFSLLSDEAKTFFDQYDADQSNIKFWDSFNQETISLLKSNGLDDKDLKVGTTKWLVWRWAFIPEIKTVLSDWSRASFNELYERACQWSAVRAADSLTDYIYGRWFVSDFYYLTEEALLELRDTGRIVREWPGYSVIFQTDSFYPMSQSVRTNRWFKFSIVLGDWTVFYLDNHVTFSKAYKEKLPPIMKWSDWYQEVMRAILNRLNDSQNTKLSRTEFNHNIAKYLQSSKTQNELAELWAEVVSPQWVRNIVDSLENAVRKGYDQIMHEDNVKLDDFTKYVAQEAYTIYLYNWYIPHGAWGNRITNALFGRKKRMTIDLIKEIEASWNKNIKWWITPNDDWKRAVYIEMDFWDWAPRYIGWHLTDSDTQDFLDAWLDVASHEAVSDRVVIWKKSIIWTSSEEYKAALSKENVTPRWVRAMQVGKTSREILEETRPDLFKWMQISYQLYPFINRWEKYVYGDWKVTPVTLISEWRHLENRNYINNIHKKYNISIENASPNLRKEIKELTNEWRKNNKWTWDSAKRRMLVREYRDLLREKKLVDRAIEQKRAGLKELDNNQIYRLAKKLQWVLEENPEVAEVIKDVDDAVMVKAKELATKVEADAAVDDIKPEKQREKSIPESKVWDIEPETPKQEDMEMSEWLKMMNEDSARYWIKDNDIPKWDECSYSMLEKAKSLDYMYAKYGEDIDRAMERVERKIMEWESMDDATRDRARIQRKINTIENEVKEWKKERSVDARREKIREVDIQSQSEELDQFQAADMFDDLRDSNEIEVYNKYHWLKAEDDKLRKLIETEDNKRYPSGTFIESVAKIDDLDKRLEIAELKLDEINKAIPTTKGKKRTEELIKEKNRYEYLIEQTKQEMDDVEQLKYEQEGEEAMYGSANVNSQVCSI